jgi:hypothetical protein
MSEVGETGACTPFKIAQKYGYTKIGKLLEEHSITLIPAADLPTFHYKNSDDIYSCVPSLVYTFIILE